jgi:citrate lyase subunit beta/citryl-CoA lyase
MVFINENSEADFRFRRSVLFMPASNSRALEKAPSLDCDCVIIDLEDAIASDSRTKAHENLRKLAMDRRFNHIECIIRLSQYGAETFEVDLVAALACKPDALLVPKVNEARTLVAIADRLGQMNNPARLWAMIETPLGLMNLNAIASASSRLQCLVVGPNDLARHTGVKLEPGRAVLKPWLMMVIAAARAQGLGVLDGVYNRFEDKQGFAAECSDGAAMGFDGKTLIHPSQISMANSAFGPSQQELARAREIIAVFELPQNRSKGVIAINGEMVERLHYDMAVRLTRLVDRS